jgi:hypothetical protein
VPELPPIEVPSTAPSIRERLRQWEIEHADAFQAIPPPSYIVNSGDVLNSATRPQPGEFQVETEEDEVEEGDAYTSAFYSRGMVDVGSKRTFLLPGDLVELLYVTCSLCEFDRS